MDAIDELWQRLLEREPDDPDASAAERLVALFSQVRAKTGGCELGVPDEADTFTEMIVSKTPEPAVLRWAYEALSLACIGQAGDDYLLVDREADGDGYQRVYVGSAGEPHLALAFKDADAFAEWAHDHLKKKGKLPRAKLDPWARDPRSAERCLELVMQMHPARIFEAYRMKRWVEAPEKVPPYRASGVAASRCALLYTLHVFLRDKKARVPDKASDADLSETHLALISHLEDLSIAMTQDEVPSVVAEAALADEGALAEAAGQWMELFDRARAQVGRGDVAMQEATQQLLAGLKGALDEMKRRELIEIEAPVLAQLADELLEVALKTMPMAASLGRVGPKHLLGELRNALLESDRLEDVYADDAEIDRIFASSLGLAGR